MSWLDSNIISFIIFLPVLGALLLTVFPAAEKNFIKYAGLVISLVIFLFSLKLLTSFDSTEGGFQFVQNTIWITSLNISYHVGIDGISLFIVLLTTFLTPLVILNAFSSISDRMKEYIICMLLLEAGMIGALVSLDLFLFYIFWEFMLIPMYFIIGVWGGTKKIHAAIVFFIYTMVGSLLMLVAILYIYFSYTDPTTGQHTFNLLKLYQMNLPHSIQLWLFLAFGLAFAIKVPMFPFHTWLPLAHVEAPTGGSVILAAVLLKMGTYGFLRFAMPLFPSATLAFAPLIGVIALIGIIYGALVAMVQPDMKKLIAYSSVSHLGFCMLGMMALNTQGIQGSILQMINHGISTGALFLIVGVIYERRHTRMIKDFGGLAKQIPIFAALFMIFTLSSIGLPGTNGFIGEFLVLLGTFTSHSFGMEQAHSRIYAIIAASGVIFAAVYMLWMYRRVMFGPITHEVNKTIKDVNFRELVIFIPLVVMVFTIGLFPNFFLSRMDKSVDHFISSFNQKFAQKRIIMQDTNLHKKVFPLKVYKGNELLRPHIKRLKNTTFQIKR